MSRVAFFFCVNCERDPSSFGAHTFSDNNEGGGVCLIKLLLLVRASRICGYHQAVRACRIALVVVPL